jgi:hypothetical protein
MMDGREEGRQLVRGQDDREPVLPTSGVRDVLDRPRPAEGDGIEELQGGVDLAVRVVGQVPDFDLVEQKGPDLRLPEVDWGAHIELGEPAGIEQIVAAGGGTEVAEAEVLRHPILELTHAETPRWSGDQEVQHTFTSAAPISHSQSATTL